MEQGNKLKGALTKAPREKAMQRLSPGVYRGEKGGLVTAGGRAIQRPQQQPQQPQRPPQQGSIGSMIGSATPRPGATNENLQGMSPEDMAMYYAQQAANRQEAINAAPEPMRFSQVLPQGPMQNQMFNFPQMPQPSANNGGQYRLSPGVYGTRDQAMQQYNQQMQDMGMSRPIYQVPQGQAFDFVKPEQIIPYLRRG